MTMPGGDRSVGGEGALCIRDLLAAQAERSPGASAIAAPGRRELSYGRLFGHIEGIVTALNSMGVGRGDRVAVVLPNGPEMATAFLSVAAGASCAPLNPDCRAAEFDGYLSDLRARALIVQSGLGSAAVEAARARGINVIRLSPARDAEAGLFVLDGATAAPARRTGFSEPQDEALVLHTSGTTSRPKIVPLTQTDICMRAHSIGSSLELTPADRCLNVMPLFHVHGLIAAVLTSVASGGAVICTPGFDAERFLEWLEAGRATWYTAVPTVHQAVLARVTAGGSVPRGTLRLIRSCSAAMPGRAMARLEEAFGVPVIEAYAMLEVGHQIACNPLPPGVRKPGSVGIARGPEVGIMDEEGKLLATGGVGEIVVRGADVIRGYENDPAASARAFTDGWFRTGDQGFLDADRYLHITGRFKEIINRGGEKVVPREVDDVLMEHPAVAEAATFAVPHAHLGEDVVAAVVLRGGAAATGAQIRDFAATRLAASRVPRQVLIVGEIPRGSAGKVQRSRLGEHFGPKLRTDFVAPRTSAERLLAGIWAELLKVERVGANDNFFALGGSSLLAAEMLSRLRTAAHLELPLDALSKEPTVATLAAIIEERVGERVRPPQARDREPDRSLVLPIQPLGSLPPLFIMPFGMGWEMLELSQCLGQDQPLYALMLPSALGEDGRRTDVRTLAARYVDQVRAVRPSGPYVLGGVCAGGVIAFEMAQRLLQQGQSVPLLALFDVQYPPHDIVPHSVGLLRMRLPDTMARIRKLGPAERRVHLRQRLGVWANRIVGGAAGRREGPERSASGHPGRRRGDSWSAVHVAAKRLGIWRYAPQPYPGRLVQFLSADTGVWPFRDRRLYWRRVAAGPFEVHVVPGHHEEALREPHVQVTAEKLKACIRGAQASGL